MPYATSESKAIERIYSNLESRIEFEDNENWVVLNRFLHKQSRF